MNDLKWICEVSCCFYGTYPNVGYNPSVSTRLKTEVLFVYTSGGYKGMVHKWTALHKGIVAKNGAIVKGRDYE